MKTKIPKRLHNHLDRIQERLQTHGRFYAHKYSYSAHDSRRLMSLLVHYKLAKYVQSTDKQYICIQNCN